MLVAFIERPFLRVLHQTDRVNRSLVEKPKVLENFRWTGLGQKT
jgi:hypothetical protein